jgi:hypothetical protein
MVGETVSNTWQKGEGPTGAVIAIEALHRNFIAANSPKTKTPKNGLD